MDKCPIDQNGERPDDFPICSGYIEPPTMTAKLEPYENNVKPVVALALSDRSQESSNLASAQKTVEQLLEMGIPPDSIVKAFNRISSNPSDYGMKPLPEGLTVKMLPSTHIQLFQNGKPITF